MESNDVRYRGKPLRNCSTQQLEHGLHYQDKLIESDYLKANKESIIFARDCIVDELKTRIV